MASRWLTGALVGLILAIAPTAGALAGAPATGAADAGDEIELTLFYGAECPHCAAEERFLDELRLDQPRLVVHAYEVWHDATNRARFRQVATEHGIEASAVPTTIVGDQVWVGFNDAVAAQIERAVAALADGQAPVAEARTTVDVPLLGAVDVGGRPLVVATLLIGFVDGVNPCSLWVLSMLLALVLHSGSRGRVLAVGTTFLVITALLYGLFIAGLFTALDFAGEAAWVRLAIAAVAGGFGVLHLKEYVTSAGPSLTIPDARKPGLYRRMRRLADPGRALPVALVGTAVLAVGVSAVETPCTAGLPVLWTNLLRAQGVGWAGWTVLLGLYLAVFLVDELVVFGLAVVTMRATRLQERHGRALQLVSGTLLVTLAVTMVAAPALLQSVAGTAWVFATAAAVVTVVLLAEVTWRHHRPAPLAPR